MIKQPRTKYPKIPKSSCITIELNQALERESRKFNVSKSFVIAVALADALGVDYSFSYITTNGNKKAKKQTFSRKS